MGKLLTVAVLALAAWGAHEFTEMRDQVLWLRAEVQALNHALSEVQEEAGGCGDEVDTLKSDLESLDSRVGDLEP